MSFFPGGKSRQASEKKRQTPSPWAAHEARTSGTTTDRLLRWGCRAGIEDSHRDGEETQRAYSHKVRRWGRHPGSPDRLWQTSVLSPGRHYQQTMWKRLMRLHTRSLSLARGLPRPPARGGSTLDDAIVPLVE